MKTAALIVVLVLVPLAACSDGSGVEAAGLRSIGEMISELDVDLDELRTKLEELSVDAREELSEALRAIDIERFDLEQKLKGLVDSRENDAEEVRKHLQRAYDALERQIDDLIAEFE